MSKKKECNVPSCAAHQYRAGVCREHHRQNYTLACSVASCEREVFAKGRCKPHYMRFYRKKHGEGAPPAEQAVRGYGQVRFDVFTRIDKEAAEVILAAAGRKDGMYEKAKEILEGWARRQRRAEAAAT